MILVDAGGCVVPILGTDTIRIKGAAAAFTFATPTLCDSGDVQFTNTVITNDSIYSYKWDFGDGDTSALPHPLHFYTKPGVYYPRLTVRTYNGCMDSITSVLPVRIVASPQAQIAQSPDGCTPLPVTFNGSLAIPDTSLVTWKWSFGNGRTSTLQNPPPEIYTTAGVYNVSLLATNSSGCKDSIISTVNALLVPTISAGIDTMICLGTGTIINAVGGSTYLWDQIAGLSCYDCYNPVANPDSTTIFIVTGTAANGCKNKDSVLVNVHYPFSIVESAPDTLCLGGVVKLLATGANNDLLRFN